MAYPPFPPEPTPSNRPQLVNVHEAKTQLSRLLLQVEQGEEIWIARAGKPVARLSAWVPTPSAAPSDLFDQLLLVQSRQEPLLLLTADAALRSCGATVLGLEPAAPTQP